jgi:ubiquinone/menaquinone biosynthesis C-methylase UbiE
LSESTQRKTDVNDAIASFDAEIPRNYDHYLGPVLFHPYAADLGCRVAKGSLADVLELACGTGILTQHLLRDLLPATRIVATDVSGVMLDFARSRLGASAHVEWRKVDAMQLPFPSASFDAVVCQFGWMFVPDKALAAREARRVLRPGGSLLFNVWDCLAKNDLARIAQATLEEHFPNDPPQFLHVAFGCHQRDTLRTNLEKSGFQHVSIEEVVKRSEVAPARQVATGLLTGTPLGTALQQRGIIDPSALIDSITARLARELGDPPASAQLLALVITAKAA